MCIWLFVMGLFIVVCLCFLLIVCVIWVWVWDDLCFDTHWLFIDCILYLIVWFWLMFCCNYVRWLDIMHIFLVIDCLFVAGVVCLCWFCLLFMLFVDPSGSRVCCCWLFLCLVVWLYDRLVYVVLFWIWCWLFMFVLFEWMVGCYVINCCFDTCVLLFVVNCFARCCYGFGVFAVVFWLCLVW